MDVPTESPFHCGSVVLNPIAPLPSCVTMGNNAVVLAVANLGRRELASNWGVVGAKFLFCKFFPCAPCGPWCWTKTWERGTWPWNVRYYGNLESLIREWPAILYTLTGALWALLLIRLCLHSLQWGRKAVMKHVVFLARILMWSTTCGMFKGALWLMCIWFIYLFGLIMFKFFYWASCAFPFVPLFWSLCMIPGRAADQLTWGEDIFCQCSSWL